MKEEQVRKKEELRTNKEVRLEYAKKLKETWKKREQKPNIWEEEQENSIIENLFHQEQNKARTPETGAVNSNTTPRTKVDSEKVKKSEQEPEEETEENKKVCYEDQEPEKPDLDFEPLCLDTTCLCILTKLELKLKLLKTWSPNTTPQIPA